MKKYRFYLLALLPLLGSCEAYLDVNPKSEVTDKELYATAEGCEDAIYGIYAEMGADKDLLRPQTLVRIPRDDDRQLHHTADRPDGLRRAAPVDDRRRRHHRRRHLGGWLQGDRAHQQGPDAHSAQSRRRISPYQALQGRAARPARLHALRNGAPLRRIVRLGRHRGQDQGHSLREELRHRSHPVQLARQGVRGDRRRPHRSRKVPRRGRGAGHPGAHQRRRRLHQLPHHPPEPLRRAGDAGPRILDGGQPGTGRKVCRKGDRQREIPPDADRGGVECRGDRHAQHAGDPLRTLLDAVPQELLRQTHLQRRHARALRRVQGGVRHGRSRHRQAVHPLVQHQHGTVHQALRRKCTPTARRTPPTPATRSRA